MFAANARGARAILALMADRDEDEAAFVCGMRLNLEAGRDPFVAFAWDDYLPPHCDNTLPGSIEPGTAKTHGRAYRPRDKRPAEFQFDFEEARRRRRAEIERIAEEQWQAARFRSGSRFILSEPGEPRYGQVFTADSLVSVKGVSEAVRAAYPEASDFVLFQDKGVQYATPVGNCIEVAA